MNKLTPALLVAALALAGCQAVSAISGFSVTQNQLDAAVASYDGTSLATLDKYAGLVRCKTGQTFTLQAPCHDKAILKKWRGIDATVAAAITKTQDMITSGNNSGAVAAWTTLQTAFTAAQQIAATSAPGL